MSGQRRMWTETDREEISRGIAENLEGKVIAARIGRCPSVVSREIARHGGRARYRAVAARRVAAERRRRPKPRKLDADPQPRARTVARGPRATDMMRNETGKPATAGPASPATVVVTRTVDPGRQDEYRRRLARLISAAEAFPNNLGTVVLAPTPGEPNEFRLVHRFSDEASLRAWEDSDIRRELSAEADAFSTSQRQEATGMEAWFTVRGAPALPPPKKWKMAAVTFIVAYGLTALIIPREMAWLPRSWSFYATNVITNVLLAGLMTYVVMPTVARVLRRWLY